MGLGAWSRVRFVLCAVALAWGGCGGGIHDGFGVALTATFDSSVSGSDLLRVTAFRYVTSEMYDETKAIGRTVNRSERVIYRPKSATRDLTITLYAVDTTGAVIAEGMTGDIELESSDTTPASVTLYAPGAMPDLGVDAAPDASVLSKVSFITTPVSATDADPLDLATGDLDGDGIPDVAVACKQSGKVQVFYTRADGTLPKTADWETDAATTPVAIAVGDFTGDARADIAVLDYDHGALLITQDSTKKLTVGTAVPIATGVDSMTAADFDGDDRLDLAFGSSTMTGVWVLYSDMTQTKLTLTTTGKVVAIHAANLVGDNAPDLLVCEQQSSQIEIFTNQQSTSAKTFATTTTKLTAPGVVQAVAFDWDGDNDIDLYAFTPGVSNGNVTAFTNTGSGFSSNVVYGPDEADTEMHAIVANLDGDSIPDLIATGVSSQQMVVALGKDNTPPNYTKADLFYTSEGGLGALAADYFNGTTQQASIVAVNRTSASLALARGNTTGVTAARAIAFGTHPRVYDYDGDGNSDIAFITSIYLGISKGDGLGNLVNGTSVNITDATQSVLADMNGDALPDLVISGSAGDVCVAIASKNTTTGAVTFGTCTTTMHGYDFVDIGAGDFDGDGHQDVVLLDASTNANFGNQNLMLLRGDGSGGFSTTLKFPAFNAVAFVVTDITKDGKPDVVALASNGVLSVLVDGTSGLGAPTTIATSLTSGARSLATLDANQDGFVDLVIAGDTTRVLLGHGDGTFTDNGQIYGQATTSVAAGDADGDGRDDVIVMTDHSIIVIPSAVAGQQIEFAAGASLTQMIAARVTKDALVDVVASGARMSLLVNNTQ